MDNFTIHQNNPNAERGGGGCLCSDMKDRDCHGPYVVWDATDMASPDNPYPVACKRCIAHALSDMESKPPVDFKRPKAPETNDLDEPEKERGTNGNGFVELEL